MIHWTIMQHRNGAKDGGYVAIEYNAKGKAMQIGSNYCAPELARSRIYIRQKALGLPVSEEGISYKLDERFNPEPYIPLKTKTIKFGEIARLFGKSPCLVRTWIKPSSKNYRPDFPQPIATKDCHTYFKRDEIMAYYEKEQQNAK